MRGGGMSVQYERLETSKKRLKVHWTTPVPVGEETLDFATALKEVRGQDARPLLIMRDCDRCKGADDALLSKTLDNEKTVLYTQWFHCAKLDRQVVEPSHPWHALFAGEKPPHLFLTTWDGQIVIPLPGDQSQKELWGAIERVLKNDYKKDARIAVKGWFRVLDKYDALDSREKELTRQVDELLAKGNDKRADRLRKQLDEIAKERTANAEKEQQVMDLVLRHAPDVKTRATFDKEAATKVEAGPGAGLLDRIRKGSGDKPGSGQPDGK